MSRLFFKGCHTSRRKYGPFYFKICSSCNKVIAEFASKYPKIDLEVIHNNGNRIKP
ncbi:deaminase domain-containing protein [Peribacillus asahii]|uniref:deaminase domain-containing protein n=1 Tax=Peribacillus asahii TaxID=228899 RepID=UPI00380C6191